MAKLPEKGTLQQIDALFDRNYPRPHLGGSVIGHQCRRYLVYSFRWAYKNHIESKLNRIFRIGDAIEELVIKDLEKIGILVTDMQGQVGGYLSHGGGSIDGILQNVPEYPDERLLFECKSANHTNFLDMKKKGIRLSKPQYYGQATVYMGKLELKRTMFVVVDKNTSEVYIEFIEFDEDHYIELRETERDVILATNIDEFPRISANPSWYMCKFCGAKEACHYNVAPEKNCRTCNKCMLVDTYWLCMKDDQKPEKLSVEQQEKGCGEWTLSQIFNETSYDG